MFGMLFLITYAYAGTRTIFILINIKTYMRKKHYCSKTIISKHQYTTYDKLSTYNLVSLNTIIGAILYFLVVT